MRLPCSAALPLLAMLCGWMISLSSSSTCIDGVCVQSADEFDGCKLDPSVLAALDDLGEFGVDVSSFSPSSESSQLHLPTLRILLDQLRTRNSGGDVHARAQAADLFELVVGESQRVDSSCFSSWASVHGESAMRLKRTSQFISAVFDALVVPRDASPMVRQDGRVRVVVVGAGPVGLLSALEAYRQGGDVRVVDKRGGWTRNIWFDLYGDPWSTALGQIARLGYAFQDVEYQTHQNTSLEVITMRAQVLERFLAKVASVVDVPLRQHTELVALCSANPSGPTHQPRPYGVFHVARASTPPAPPAPELVEQFVDSPEFWCAKGAEELSALFRESADSFVTIPFDVLVGADGKSSRVRTAAAIPTEKQSVVKLFPALDLRVNVSGGLRQTTLIANFKPTGSPEHNGCSPLKGTHWKYSPPYSSFVTEGVTSVFKRFYHGHCHMQVLLSNDYGRKLKLRYQSEMASAGDWMDEFSMGEEDSAAHVYPFHVRTTASPPARSNRKVRPRPWQQKAYPWELLRRLANYYFADEFSSTHRLRRAIERRADDPSEFHIDFFDVEIHRANTTSKLLLPLHQGSGGRMGLITLQGDSAVTAHYRLGVGINRAFAAVSDVFAPTISSLGSLSFDPFATSAPSEELMQVIKFADEKYRVHNDDIVQYQLRVMFMESYCDLVVMFEPSAPSVYESIMVFAKDHERGDLMEETLGPEEILDACSLAQHMG